MKKQNPKRKHHFITQLYLKGFTESDTNIFTWQYERGKEYNPGSNKYNNPYHASIRIVGFEKDRYTYQKQNGEMDYETFENILEKLEKPSDKIFVKLRSYKSIDENEKNILASYMGIMIKRVPKRDKKAEKLYWNHVNNFDWDKLQQYFQERGKFGLALEAIKIKNQFKEKVQKDVILSSMVIETNRLKDILVKMKWLFLTAPKDSFFVTNDCPIIYNERIGIAKINSIVIFPIGRKILLFVSNLDVKDLQFTEISLSQVNSINQLIIQSAHKYVYADRNDPWIFEMLNSNS